VLPYAAASGRSTVVLALLAAGVRGAVASTPAPAPPLVLTFIPDLGDEAGCT
jgi:hypothetical protein